MHFRSFISILLALGALHGTELKAAQGPTILALGDSITQRPDSYRQFLVPAVQTEWPTVAFVGPEKDAVSAHAGYGGKHTAYLRSIIGKLYADYPADIVLIHSGHNSFSKNKPVPGIIRDTESIIETIHGINPRASILLAQVIPAGKLPKYSYIPALNRELSDLCERMESKGVAIYLVDQVDGFDWKTDTQDDKVHVNKSGAKKMATKWMDALRTVRELSPAHGGEMNLDAMLLPVPPEAKLANPDFHVWGGSMVQDADGKYHLFYSRWPRDTGFSGWLTHSEIARAVADKPTGPYRHVDVVLPARDKQLWDGLCTHNPTVHEFDGKYYLYYMGTTGDGKITESYNWVHRNNQRIGVAVADHPAGPWKRFDEPLIDVSPDKAAPDALMVSNPSICRRPDGSFLLIYKCVGKKKKLPFGGPVTHRVATSTKPLGPFTKQPGTVFEAAGDSFPAEDPYIWVQDEKLWAIVKDMRGSFTGKAKSMALFESEDGLEWQLSKNPLVTTTAINWQEQGRVGVDRLERPQLWLDQGQPKILFCAVKERNGDTYNIHIPLSQNISP